MDSRRDAERRATGAANEAPETIDRFVVLDVLGSGAMGIVYAAWDPQLDRRVALKVVRPGKGGGDAESRLVREAQGMARLSHPNVVSVFDVGAHAGGVWIAMEFVAGETLHARIGEGGLDWRERLELYRQAGEGLCAAHEAGLVHRDFKPENVLIGAQGRVRVADFGLVRPSDQGAETLPDPIRGDELLAHARVSESGERDPEFGALQTMAASTRSLGLASGSGMSARLTMDEAWLGTPRFMSPEQFQRMPADARSDQFSFCVALYHALYEEWPFQAEGGGFFELAAAVTLGSAPTLPSHTAIPPQIGAALLRGLAREPEDRFPDMRALLDALELAPPQRRRWPWLLASLGGAMAAAALTAWVVGSPAPEPVDPCSRGEAEVARSWGEAQRAQLAARFEGLDIGFGASSLEAIDEGVRAWSQDWAGAYRETCETRHEQSDLRYDMRMNCLAEQRAEVDGLIALFSMADEDLVRDAPDLVSELPAADACETLEGRRAVEPPRADQLDVVHEVRGRLARVRARLAAAELDGLDTELELLGAEVEVADYEPLLAELDYLRGVHAMKTKDVSTAQDWLLAAHGRALALGQDRLAMTAARDLVLEDGAVPGDEGQELARRWHAVTAALERRIDGGPEDEVERRYAYGRAMLRQMRFEPARGELSRAAELAAEVHGPHSLVTARIEVALGTAYGEGGKYEPGEQILARAIDTYERRLGPDHPLLIGPLLSRTTLHTGAGQLDAALADAKRAQRIDAASYTDGGPRAENILHHLALVHDLRGDYERAAANFEAMLARRGELQRPSSVNGMTLANSLCFSLYKLDRLDEAEAVCARSLELAPEVLGDGHPITAIVLNNLALIARARGDFEAGLELDRKALGYVEDRLGADHFYIAYSLVGVAEGLLGLGRADEAVPVLERAWQLRQEQRDPGEQGEVECLLGQALIDSGQDRERGRALEREAAVKLRAAGPNWNSHAEACDARVAGH
ncbi:serine/threonine-protein kinase [Plesiocystis pacifica]|uniref:serine/threonine-protein kinase n=1 Tax=Plesiocystis pacifica TaxID=191768 RepID=UPI0018DC4E5E|nr:serine/threonine-protein kinase [Plesiocystis pacifica]